MSKVSKRRYCPAVTHEITPAECGENRGSHYACPADCIYSPMAPANYSQLLEIEDALDKKCMAFIKDETRRFPSLDKAMQKAYANHSIHAIHAFYEWQFFFRRDDSGLTLTEKWERAAGLKNDERVLLRAKMQTRVALLEIHRVLDDQRIEAVDLLCAEPKPFLLQDRSLAAMAVRFGTALVWIYPLPHYRRLSGTAIVLPEMAQFEAAEIVSEIARHLGGPATENELRLWLAENFVRFDEALHATANARRLQMFAGVDAQFGKAVYELRASFGECRDMLDDVPEIEPDRLAPNERDEGFAEARVWFSDEEAVKFGSVRPALGRVLLGQSHCRLEAMGAERLARLREQFETQLGGRVRFTGELRDDLAVRMKEKEPKINESLVPPKLLEQPQKILLSSSRVDAPPRGKSLKDLEHELFLEQDRAFLDDSIPALEGRTPRQAARDPAVRPKLIRLMKQRVRMQDERNLETGQSNDLNWMLRELGLNELIFDPPPIRPPREKMFNQELAEEEDDLTDTLDFPPAPPLPDEPFSLPEAMDRLAEVMVAFDSAAQALGELEASGSTFIDDAWSVVADMVEDQEFDVLVAFLVQARFALVPAGFHSPALNFDRLCDAFDTEMEKFVEAMTSSAPKQTFELFEASRQPALTQIILAQFLEAIPKMPKKIRPRLESQPILAVLLKVMIDELDRKLRR